MVYASIERPPVLGGKLKELDDQEARKVTGVQQTVAIEGAQPPYGFQALGGVAVIANNTWAASQGRKKLKIDWEYGPHAIFAFGNLQEIADRIQRTSRKEWCASVGDVDAAFDNAAKVVEGDLLHAAACTCAHGAAGRRGRLPRRQSGGLGRNAKSARGADTVAKALGIKPKM